MSWEPFLKLGILSVSHASLRRNIYNNCRNAKELAHFHCSSIDVFCLEIAKFDIFQACIQFNQNQNKILLYLELLAPISKNQGVKYLFTKNAAKSVAATALEEKNNYVISWIVNRKKSYEWLTISAPSNNDVF